MPDYSNPSSRLGILLTRPKYKPMRIRVPDPKPKKTKASVTKVDWSKVSEVVEAPVSKEVAIIEADQLIEAKILPSDKLGSLLDKALKTYEEILNIEIDPSHENYCAIMRIKASACEKIVGTQTKVDENQLRARNDSRLGDILDRLTEAKKRLNLTIAVS